MALVWRFLSGAGEEIGRSERFGDRQSAESWMSESWEDLVGRGIQDVVLVDEEGESPLYRMGLQEE